MSMRRKHSVAGVGVMAAILSGGCPSKSFDHGDPPIASTSAATFTSAGGEVGDSGSPNADGNYPDPAVSRCGDVLGNLPPIHGLASAWAVVAVPGATMDEEPVVAGSVLLRISGEAISDCGAAPNRVNTFGTGSSGTGTGGSSGTSFGGSFWEERTRGFEVMLGPDELSLGVHEVATLTAPRVTVFGEGATSDSGAEANIELLHVDDDCIIGVARGFVTNTGTPILYGGFVAETCQRQCIPAKGKPC